MFRLVLVVFVFAVIVGILVLTFVGMADCFSTSNAETLLGRLADCG